MLFSAQDSFFDECNMNISRRTTCFLTIVVIFACSVSSQFTFTGFPTAQKRSTHTVTCSYPGATSYNWRFKGGTYNGSVYTFTADLKHYGVWECDAVVNGVIKTSKEYLLLYCDEVYVTSATTTKPSIGDPLDLSCKVLSPSGNLVQWSMVTPGFKERAIAGVTNSGCEYYHTENDNIKFAPSTTCATSTSNQFFNLKIKKMSTAHEGYWICYDIGKSSCDSRPLRIAIAKPPKDPPTLTGFDNPNLGTDHNLTCDAWQLDVRPLTYTWYKDGVQISSGNTSTWRLQPVKKEDYGRYRCEVVDIMKNLKAEAEDTLRVHSPPDPPSDLKALKLKDANALAVSFTAGSNGGAPQTFTIEYNVKGENKIEYIRGIQDPLETKTVTQDIENLRSNTVYQIKTKAVNSIGASQYSHTIEAKTESAGMPVWQIAVMVAALILLSIVDVVIFFIARRRRNATGRHDHRTPVLPETDTNPHKSSQKMQFCNEAFEGDGEPYYVHHPRQAGEVEHAYANLTPHVRDNSALWAEPEYANMLSQAEGKGETTPTYVNTAPRTKDSDFEVYEDISSPYSPYEGLDMTRKSVDDQPYESLKITNSNI